MDELMQTQVLILRWREGEDGARDALIGRLHPELSRIAAARLRREMNSSLSTGDLINEAVMRLIETEGLGLQDRKHLIALASRLMRHILTDHARAKNQNLHRTVPPDRAVHRTSISSE